MTSLATSKDNPLDNIDSNRFSIIERQLAAKNSESNQNRAFMQELMNAEGRLNDNRRAVMSQPRVLQSDLDNIDRELKEIANQKSDTNRRYVEISEEIKPIIILRNNCKDFLLSNGLPLPFQIGRGAPFATFIGKRPEYESKLVPPKANGGKRSTDPVQAYSTLKDRHEAIKREKRTPLENQPNHPEEIIAKWEVIIDHEAEIGRASSPCVHDPDTRDARTLIPDSFANQTTGRVNQAGLFSVLCAMFPDQIKQFIRALNPPRPGAIGSKERAAKLKEIDEEIIAVQFELEKAARVIEAKGMQVIRPGDLDPRIFLAREI